ncbi:XRE family transcriptional regulator [Streptomyces sp. 549]|uniref:XRE family transcriptional regulator n=1 Tax=Streptomyces sp. 549 TaxID=3049076 RepID=UPI0024C3391E|nr:XRE family transcriptional regulator [Streptomyces sp. 549]MDK1473690.1 XRE family transcriptional regulator [Streptomyces sp. 549]
MLEPFTRKNTLNTEVNVDEELPPYLLVDRDLLRTVMKRTGNGRPTNTRELAATAGVAHGVIGELLTGVRDTLPGEAAHAVARRIGVDVLILFIPTGRSVPATVAPEAVAS